MKSVHRIFSHNTENPIKLFSFYWYLDLIIYIVLLFLCYVYLLNNFVYNEILKNYASYGIFSVIGIIGISRLSEKIYNYTRSVLFIFYTSRKVKNKVDFNYIGRKLFIVVTSYKKGHKVNRTVQKYLLNSISDLKIDTHVVFMLSPGKLGEEEKKVLEKDKKLYFKNRIDKVSISYQPQKRKGKRFAIYEALKIILNNIEDKSILLKSSFVFMDGDTLIEKGTLERSLPYVFHERIGGITLDNKAYSEGGIFFTNWLYVRFLRRNADCSSKLSVLTGRFSIVRGSIINDTFLKTLKDDVIEYPFLGEIKSLNGDDKTMVKLVKKQGYDIFYLNDESVIIMEEPISPDKDNKIAYMFFSIPFFNNILNMVRYKRNMFRHGIDFLKEENIRKDKAFTYKVFSQFIFSFTPILALYFVIILTYYYGPYFLVSYIFYVLVSRGIETFTYGAIFSNYWSANFVYMQYIEVLKESFVNMFAIITVDKQKWPNSIAKIEYAFSTYVLYILIVHVLFVSAFFVV